MTDVNECYKAHENIEEICVAGQRVDAPLPSACPVCGHTPIVYARHVAVYDPEAGFVGMVTTAPDP